MTSITSDPGTDMVLLAGGTTADLDGQATGGLTTCSSDLARLLDRIVLEG